MDRHIRILERAIGHVVRSGHASPGLLQRKLGIGYRQACRLIDEMTWIGIVDARRSLVTPEEWRQVLAG